MAAANYTQNKLAETAAGEGEAATQDSFYCFPTIVVLVSVLHTRDS